MSNLQKNSVTTYVTFESMNALGLVRLGQGLVSLPSGVRAPWPNRVRSRNSVVNFIIVGFVDQVSFKAHLWKRTLTEP